MNLPLQVSSCSGGGGGDPSCKRCSAATTGERSPGRHAAATQFASATRPFAAASAPAPAITLHAHGSQQVDRAQITVQFAPVASNQAQRVWNAGKLTEHCDVEPNLRVEAALLLESCKVQALSSLQPVHT